MTTNSQRSHLVLPAVSAPRIRSCGQSINLKKYRILESIHWNWASASQALAKFRQYAHRGEERVAQIVAVFGRTRSAIRPT